MERFYTAFRRNADGSWTCIAAATYEGPLGRIQVTPGSTFSRGTTFMNVDLARMLDDYDPSDGNRG
jgi:hypothetical protein